MSKVAWQASDHAGSKRTLKTIIVEILSLPEVVLHKSRDIFNFYVLASEWPHAGSKRIFLS